MPPSTHQTTIRERASAIFGDPPRRRKAPIDVYARYVFKVLRRVHPTLSISSAAVRVVNSMIVDIFNRIVAEATDLAKHNGKLTITHSEIQSAVRLTFPGELYMHAAAEGKKALANTRAQI